jgi:hypothetical protein
MPQRRARFVRSGLLWILLGSALLSTGAWGNTITLTLSDADVAKGKTGMVSITGVAAVTGSVKENGKVVKRKVFTPITGQLSIPLGAGKTAAGDKADALFDAMGKKDSPFKSSVDNGMITHAKGAASIVFTKVPANLAIELAATDTGENPDILESKGDPTLALLEWNGTFDNSDANGKLASFTAGVFTRFGVREPTLYPSELAANLSLNPSGCSALQARNIAGTFFNKLEPFASSLGVEFSEIDTPCTEGLIYIDFLPAASQNAAGVAIGSTSADGTIIEAIDAQTIPEPASFSLLGTCVVLGLLAYARKSSLNHRPGFGCVGR